MDALLYRQVKASIKRELKIDLENYKADQMQRRLDSWLVRSQALSWEAYFTRLSADNLELEKFRNYLTINVTEFFRDPHRWQTLRAEIIPYLLKNRAAPLPPNVLSFWSAGCSIGAEPYSLAILMAEAFPRQDYSVLATDLDRGALARARARGPYTWEDLHNLDAAQRQRYVSAAAPYHIEPGLQQHIRFAEQDLLADRFGVDYDLIICRNVVIYFTTEAKDVLYAKFAAALRPGGILFLGGTEIISSANRFGLQNFGVGFYKKG